MAHITTLTRAYNDLYNSQANTYSYSGSFETFKESEVKVTLNNNNVITTLTYNSSPSDNTQYSVNLTDKTIHVGGSNLTSGTLSIYPETDLGSPTLKAPYTAGSAITASDLTNNQKQVMRKLMEHSEKKFNNAGDTMTGDLTMGEDTKIIFEGATDDAHETTLTVTDPTADRTITLPNVTGTVVTTGDTGSISSSMIANDAVGVNHIADNSITSNMIQNGAVNSVDIANDAVTADKIANDALTGSNMAAGTITTAKIADDAITSAKIADNQVGVDHIADNSITSNMIQNGAVASVDIADNAIVTAKIASGAVTTTQIADGTIQAVDLATNAVATDRIADGAVTTVKIADSNVTTAKIADSAVTAAKIASDSITGSKIANNAVNTAEIENAAVTTAKIAADNITNALIADDQIDSEHYVDGSIDTAHIGSAQVTDAKLASNSVVTSKITDANVTTVKIADSNVTLAKLASDLKQTSISDSDTQLPTSGAVVDYVAAQIAPLGGLEVIATEVAFPNSQPSSGVVISISDAAGVVVNGSGVSTTGRTVGGSTVTINNFPSSLNGETLAAGVGLMVSSTGSSQTYNYHKILAAETDVKQLSDDINDFNERYRVDTTNPTSSLNAGDLFFNTTSSKLLVYNGSTNAWEEAQSIGQFFINTLSSYSGTGGNSATFNGSAYRFVLSNPGANAEQHLVSINGVVQKPNSGTSQPSEGFAIDGSSIIFSSAPASNADFFIITIGASVNIGTPSAGTVATLQLANGAVTTDKLADANVTQAKLADQAVNEAKLQVSNSPTNGYFLSAQSGNTGGLTWAQVSTDLVADTSPQLGGDLDTNSHHILIDDDHQIRFGASNDLVIQHNTNENYIQSNSGHIYIRCNVDDDEGDNIYLQPKSGENSAVFVHDGEVKLFYNNALKLETTSTGVQITGNIDIDGNIDGADGSKLKLGTGDDFQIYHDGTNSIIDNTTGELQVTTDGIMRFNATEYKFNNAANNEIVARFEQDGACELYYNHSKKLETNAEGVKISGYLEMEDNQRIQMGTGDDLHIYHDGSHSRIQDAGTGKLILQGSEINLNNAASTEYCLRTIEDGAVELYHNGNKKFETTASGVDVAGNCTITGNFRGNDNVKLNLGNGDDLQIYHNGSNSIINNDTGDLYIQTDGNLKLERKDGGEDYIHCIADGAVELHYNGSKTFETTSYGIKTDNLPRQNVFNTSSSSQSVSNSEVAINASQISLTLKEANPKLVYSYHMNGELDGNRGQTFYRLFYSTNSNYSGETAATSYAFQGGGGSDGNNGGFNDSGTFVFNLTASAGTTIYLRLRYKQTDSAATEFNQSGLDGQPSGSSNVSFVRVEEFAQ